MNIRYSDHFLERKALRELPDGLAEEVFLYADAHFYDVDTDTLVAVKRIFFQGADRDIALAYSLRGEQAVFVTIHPLQESQKERRVRSGRWVSHEP